MKAFSFLKNQRGVMHLLVPLVVLVAVVIGGTYMYIAKKQDETNKQKVARIEEQNRQQAAKNAEKLAQKRTAEETAAKQAEAARAAASTSAPAASSSASTAPASRQAAPAAQAPAAAHPTQSNCLPSDGQFTVYASVASGMPTYQQSDRATRASLTVPYRQAMRVSCFSNDIQKLVYNDYFVDPGDVTVTSP